MGWESSMVAVVLAREGVTMKLAVLYLRLVRLSRLIAASPTWHVGWVTTSSAIRRRPSMPAVQASRGHRPQYVLLPVDRPIKESKK